MKKEYKTIGEVITEAQEAKTLKAKVEVLQQNETKQLRQILKLAYDESGSYKWSLPNEPAPYEPSDHPIGEGRMTIKGEIKRLYMFLDVPASANITLAKKEYKYKTMLESLDPQEAAIMEQVRLGKIDRLSNKAVKEAFPDLL